MEFIERFRILSCLTILAAQLCFGQIGYQIAVVDQSTGNARANATVSVSLYLSDNSGSVFYSQTESVITNDLGIATLQIGNETTFRTVDWSKLPLWINATIDDVSMGRTQILTVPIAEHANHTGTLTKEKLVGRWHDRGVSNRGFTFDPNGTAYSFGNGDNISFRYEIDGNLVILRCRSPEARSSAIFHYSEEYDELVGSGCENEWVLRK